MLPGTLFSSKSEAAHNNRFNDDDNDNNNNNKVPNKRDKRQRNRDIRSFRKSIIKQLQDIFIHIL